MIRAIIFDWGGVFTSNASLRQFCQEYAAKHGFDFASFNAKMIELWNAARVADIDSRRFWSELAVLARVSEAQLKEDLDIFSGFEYEVLAFVETQLKGKYNLGIITNHIETWFEVHVEKRKLSNIFDAIITSYGSRSAKPERKIYEDALAALKVTPTECVFIDDLEKNLPPAQALGMQAILYKNLPQMKADLQKLGVAV